MLQSLYTSVSGIRSHQQMLDVLANNLANVNTPGYKSSRALFADSLSSELSGLQIGMGISLSEVATDFRQSGQQFTGLPTDLALQGTGFFVLQDAASGGLYYTRDGSFSLDSSSFLVAADGLRVQGSATGVDGSAFGDLVVASTDPLNPMETFTIGTDGKIEILRSDGTTEIAGYVGLEEFVNEGGLFKAGQNMFTAPPDASPVWGAFQTPGSSGLGQIRSGYLEMSNVDMSEEFTAMIRSQRGLQASARIISTADEILQEITNLKR